MIQFFNKKMSKKRKGFTLIELVVVIAILGILMALAIPRFSGFTDKAKIASDEQYAAVVANALLVEFATDGVVADTFTIDNTGAVTSTLNTGLDITTLVEETALQYYDSMEIVISQNGDKSITYGTPIV